MEKEKRRKKGEMVISFLYVETMWVNGVDTPDLCKFVTADFVPIISEYNLIVHVRSVHSIISPHQIVLIVKLKQKLDFSIF